MLLKIKEFAEFCNVSVRALHLYDKIGLFHPRLIDENNGYRYYDTEQMLELNTITSFKLVGFSLKQIHEMKTNNFSKAKVIKMLQEKELENKKQIEILAYNNDNIGTMLKSLDASSEKLSPEEEAIQISKISCLANEKLEHDFSQILWL